ncbi:MAG TPA: NAD(P)-dependent oxidoreductase [Kofleriaceae bacterium]|nr:NAD(P)-dependent oxidoreductase [Kofleriaceae bacterium]
MTEVDRAERLRPVVIERCVNSGVSTSTSGAATASCTRLAWGYCRHVHLLYCGSGWLPIVETIRARVPDATVAVWDRRVPLVDVVRDVDVLLPSNAPITRAVIEAAPKLQLIQQPAAGVEGIDHDAARERGIPICNAPGTNHVAVAELALYLLLALARRIPHAAFAARKIGEPIGFELAGKTLGIIGMGRSGSALADRARALGMTVQALRRGDDKPAFFAACDAISIHCPLTAETRHLVDAAALAAMRPGALLINCARGGVIDRDALAGALDHLGGVGLDVVWDEPGDPADPLYSHPKVLVTPHVAGSTREAFTRIGDVIVENLARLARRAPLLHRIR